MFSRNFKNIFKNSRKYSTCKYDEPFLFGPSFSSFFFGGIYTFFLVSNIRDSYYFIKNDTENLKKEIKEIKEINKQLKEHIKK